MSPSRLALGHRRAAQCASRRVVVMPVVWCRCHLARRRVRRLGQWLSPLEQPQWIALGPYRLKRGRLTEATLGLAWPLWQVASLMQSILYLRKLDPPPSLQAACWVVVVMVEVLQSLLGLALAARLVAL